MLRRTHRKSRRGCILCKQRRVKCDERKPTCSNCATRGFDCAYASATPLIWMDDKAKSRRDRDHHRHGSPILSSDEKINGEDPLAIISSEPNLNLEGVELIIHWFTSTAETVAGNPEALKIVQTVILKQAMQHHFLLHGLLALSALHLAHSHFQNNANSVAEAKYRRIATVHHNQGLAEYHSVLKNINQENYPASIAFSSITTMYAFALARPARNATEKVGTEPIDDLAQIFLLAKGWEKVVSVARNLSCNSSGGLDPSEVILEGSLPTDTETAFVRLQELVDLKRGDLAQEGETYSQAIRSLRSVFVKLQGPKKITDPHIALAWTNTLSDEFVCLFKSHKPVALVIVAFYCVVLHRGPDVWWLSGWSKGLLNVISWNIEPEYQKELNWACEQIGFDYTAKL